MGYLTHILNKDLEKKDFNLKLNGLSVLTVSASTSECSMVLYYTDDKHETYHHWKSKEPNQHSELLLPEIKRLLTQQGLERVDYIGVDCGPGAFTSVRVSCGLVQGLALGWNSKVMAISSLEALAYTAMTMRLSEISTDLYDIVSIIDARMNECYVAHYQSNHHLKQCVCVKEPQLISYNKVKLYIDTINHNNSQNPCIVIGNAKDVIVGWSVLSEYVYDCKPSAQGVMDAMFHTDNVDLLSPELLHPLYIRNQVALTIDERKQSA